MRFKQHFSLYPRKTSKNKVIWYYRTYDENGKRSAGISTGLSSKPKAQAFCENLFKSGMLLTSEEEEKPLKLYIADFFGDTSPWVKNKLLHNQLTIEQYSQSTLKTYRNIFDKHIYPYFADLPVKAVTIPKIKEFREILSEKGIKRKTVNTVLNVLSIILNDLVDNSIIKENPVRKIKKLSEDADKVGAFTLEEVKLICGASKDNKNFYIVAVVCALTGLRVNEVIGLHKDNIFPDHIKVIQQKQGKAAKKVKDEQPRIVPIIPELYKFLIDNMLKSGFLISCSYSVVYTRFRQMCIDTNLEERRIQDNLHIHSFRHFYNTYLLAENISGVKVDAIIGHSDPEHTMQKIYTNWDITHFRDVQEVNKKLWKFIFS